MRCPVPVSNERRVLCVFPHYTPAFGTFNHAYRLMRDVRAFMPPQGLLLIAAYLPERWTVRFVDENIRRATAAELDWADVVVVSGMHVQAPQIRDIAVRAHAVHKPAVLGGPSASACPDMYPEIDYLHIGEMGDATDRIIACLDRSAARPPARGKLNWSNLSGALVLAFRVMLHIGILSDYRRPFWRAACHALRRGQIDAVLGIGFIAHHLILFTREALRGEQNASYYSTKMRTDDSAGAGLVLRKSA